jgi:S-adenosylmethionine hydrolase
MNELGTAVPTNDLLGAPFGEAELADGAIASTVIHANKFGSVILNIEDEWLDQQGFAEGAAFEYQLSNAPTRCIPRARSFSYVNVGGRVLVPDDYGRVGLAINQGSFAHKFDLKLGRLGAAYPPDGALMRISSSLRLMKGGIHETFLPNITSLMDA